MKTMTLQTILDAVRHEKLFGCIECDIHVPEHFTPEIFRNVPDIQKTPRYLGKI